MPYKLTLVLTPKQAADVKYYTEQAARRAGVAEQDVALVRVVGGRSMPGSGSPK